MILYRVLRFICLVIPIAVTSPVPLADDAFNKVLRNVPTEESVINMRIFEDSNDRQLKRVSLSSLIGDLQNNLYDTAISLNNVLTNKNFSAVSIKTNNETKHDVNKRQSLSNEKNNSGITTKLATTTTTTTESETMLPVTTNVIFEATEKNPQFNSVPTIKGFEIKNHTGGLEQNQTKNDKSANSDHNITIPKTNLTATPPNYFGSSSTTTFSTTRATSSTTAATSSTTSISATTPKNIDHLKEAEAELKEKFAEIEAEPIILSARI